MSSNTHLRAYVRYDSRGKIVPGSLVVQQSKPKNGNWKEVPYDTAHSVNCNVNYGSWKVVSGGSAGDGKVLVDDLVDQEFTIIGPNDDLNNGWAYITKYYSNGATLIVDYNYASFDESLEYDRPVYWTSTTQPTGAPDDNTAKVETVPADGSWEIVVPKGHWFAVGIYSNDSCCGRGFLSVSVQENEVYNVPGEWFLFDNYSPATTDGSITFPNHVDSEGDLNPNDVGQVDGDTLTQIYINPNNFNGDSQVESLSTLVGTNGELTLTQGSNSVTYGYTSQSFEFFIEELSNIFADNAFGTSVPGSITILSPASEDFNTVDPITIQIKINN